MSNAIHLGYEVGTGEPIEIPLRHTAVTGQTQESGKTTTLEGLIARSGRKAVAYVTKRGESSFHVAYPIPPYFQERADWKFVQSLLEASTETKLKFEQSWIMRASEGARTLQDVRANIQKFLTGVRDTRPVKLRKGAETKERWLQKPARGLSGDIYYVLNKYLDDIMPQLDRMPYSKKLELAPGLNVMDLRDYEFPLQALVVRSVIDWVHDHGENTINVIPEAWKFAPKQKGSPVRQSAEEMVREGAAMKNYLWIDSQDLAGVADVLMRQVGVWLFGVQRAKHEIERALDHMPEGLPSRRPKPQDIATLSKGQFYVCFAREMYKVYVQPAWMTGAHAEAIARGEEEVDSAREILHQYDREAKRASKKSDQRPAASDQEGKPQSALAVQAAAGLSSEIGTVLRMVGDAPSCTESQSEKEEAMWKEKYEALRLDLSVAVRWIAPLDVTTDKQLIDAATRLRVATTERGAAKNGESKTAIPEGWASFESIYAFVKDKAAKDPGILQLLTERPEIRVKIERHTIDTESGTLRGSLAILIREKFFDAAREFADVRKDLIRRGFLGSKAPNQQISQALQGLVELGFLTKEDAGYQAVPGMKIHILET